MNDNDSWRFVENTLQRIGDRYGSRIVRSRSDIAGVNMMTPEIAGVWRLPNSRTLELSYGWSDWSKCYVYGVTTRPDPDDQSQACFDFDTVEATVAAINRSDDIDVSDPISSTRKRA